MRNLRAILASLFVGVLTMLVIACGAETNPPADPTASRDAEPTSIVSQPASSVGTKSHSNRYARTHRCTYCGAHPHTGTHRCTYCGAHAHTGTHRCTYCGAHAHTGTHRCTYCGTHPHTGTHRCTYCGTHPHTGTHRCTYCGTHPHPHCRSDTYAGSDSHSGVQSGQLLLLYRGDQHQPGGHHRGALRRRSPPDRG